MQKRSLDDDYYKPSEDTLFLADFIKKERGQAALDVGTGSGFLANVMSDNFDLVVSTDIRLGALRKAHETVENCVCCNSADALNYEFDLVVCNLPYLPSEEVIDPTVDGLEEGLGVTTNIIKSASDAVKKNGRLVYLTSSLANYQELMRRTESLGFSAKIAAKKKLFFEELVLVECIKL
ncbi:MAG: methyltransferase [Thaumarchaeota archaeon]|nr:methyltransferase [Nitrososphaerota archaeon]